ncbi:MAG: hypothetical protein J6V24_04700 [Clostridia bacterium]|nr:hypothetical protein [Clostridia bacterium]
MKVTVEEVRADLDGITRRIAAIGPAVGRALGEAVIASSEPYVPWRTGRLASSVTLNVREDGTGEVRWTAPYAEECYYASRPFSRRIHPLATARWFEAAKAADSPAWIAAAQGAVKTGASAHENGGLRKDGRTAWKN